MTILDQLAGHAREPGCSRQKEKRPSKRIEATGIVPSKDNLFLKTH